MILLSLQPGGDKRRQEEMGRGWKRQGDEYYNKKNRSVLESREKLLYYPKRFPAAGPA